MNGSEKRQGGVVWTVVYTYANTDCAQDRETRTRAFSTEENAKRYLARDYESVKSECGDDDLPLGIVGDEFYGNRASVLVGDGGSEEVSAIHEWRVFRNEVDFGI